MTAVEVQQDELGNVETMLTSLAERTADVQAQRNAVSKKLELARTLHGRTLADGLKSEAEDAATQARDLAIDLEGLDRALGVLRDRTASANTTRTALELAAAERAASDTRRAMGAAGEAIQQSLRAYIRGELAALLSEHGDARVAAGAAWARLNALNVKAGRGADIPMSNPAVTPLAGYPGLSESIDALERYGRGLTISQQAAHASVQLAESARGAAMANHRSS